MESSTRYFLPPAGSLPLLGARGTGKTTWLRQTWPDGLSNALLEPALQREYQVRPERLEGLLAGHPLAAVAVIDISSAFPRYWTLRIA